MVFQPLVIATVMASTALAGTLGQRAEPLQFGCGTLANTGQMDTTQNLLKRQAGEPPDDNSLIQLDFVVHLCCQSGRGSGENGGGPGRGGCPPEGAIHKQVDITNQMFASANISFKLQKIAPVKGGCGSVGFGNFQRLQQQVHEGGMGTLNVVYTEISRGERAMGLCNILDTRSGDLGEQDGCGVAMNTLPGAKGDTMSKVTPHEIGHWLSLGHPFSENRQCGDGDGIEDTPPQMSPTMGCPNGRGGGQGVFGQAGSDGGCQPGANQNNIMDYSSCEKLSFSKGQKQRIRRAARFRKGLISLPGARGGRFGGSVVGDPKSGSGVGEDPNSVGDPKGGSVIVGEAPGSGSVVGMSSAESGDGPGIMLSKGPPGDVRNFALESQNGASESEYSGPIY
ncbi:hypothetical protein G6O67_004170 [Ophiocordyceps sinensis]|uniref:Peptidase M43 pregnancy-associated plasma-A domain-containing protein n=1 Tax=Ophiocordyceps sinensis TaxID=72228 RepID=A0A8H4PNX7_9HYPO|nr:hypothetical protein G6O67_004170 [Ophiocordyceps sinensis]